VSAAAASARGGDDDDEAVASFPHDGKSTGIGGGGGVQAKLLSLLSEVRTYNAKPSPFSSMEFGSRHRASNNG
jgi:hypothetical protein